MYINYSIDSNAPRAGRNTYTFILYSHSQHDPAIATSLMSELFHKRYRDITIEDVYIST
jgi:hypothetical protein